ncbi:xylose isomerase-like protein [Annulohypoxylon maeteangense]|uniref:xylose isomerase-like protein n=1 Tax=Annulohypoxylon maeteangense TaxID=1927788 RepID=UPI00200843D2|nr:xylose isomerase-like protein [Annulohypoxylon maeteangense]KAI0889884.1 xylose isomerase-like protein [Annulohypoxylon maeteangense]
MPPRKSSQRGKAPAVTAQKGKAGKRKIEDDEDDVEPTPEPKAAKKRKTAKGKVEDLVALATRTVIDTLKKPMYIGAHVSSAGGVQNSITNAVHIGANAFALFLKSQRKWANPPIAPEALNGFLTQSKEHRFEAHKHCLPHGSYLVNLAAAEKEKAEQAYSSFLDDLQRCESLGIKLYNFHPGNSNGEPRPEAIARIAKQLNKAHKATSTVITVLENMAGQGNVIGNTFEDLRDIIELVEDKDRVGVCIDTCHAFAAGYDLRTPETFEATIDKFNETVGSSYLKAFHLNDSKAPFDSHRDLHANIGTGFLGLRAFHSVVNHDGFKNMPMILETPIDRKGDDGKSYEDKQVWADEIKLLESLIGMDAESGEFAALEKQLQAKGTAERGKIQEQVDRKSAKDAKKTAKAAPKKKAPRGRKKAETSEDEGSD